MRKEETEEKEEKLYMVLDDTLDIGKEPLPIVTEQDKAYHERMQDLKSKFMKKKK